MARRPAKPQKGSVAAPVQTSESMVVAEDEIDVLPGDEPPFDETPKQTHWLTLLPAVVGALLLIVGTFLPHANAEFPIVARWATALALLTVALLGVALVGQQLRPQSRHRDLPTAGLVATALLALVAFRLREFAWPQLSVQATEPLRTSVQGLTLPVATAIAFAGALTLQPTHLRLPRAWLGLGVALLATVLLVPQGWLGSSVVPLWAAIAGLNVPTTSSAGVTFHITALTGAGVLLGGALVTGIAIWALVQRELPRVVWLALTIGLGLLLLVEPFTAGNAPHGIAGLGALLLASGALGQAIVRANTASKADEAWRTLWPGLEVVALALLVGVWLVLKVNGTRYSTTDEALYYYAARLWTEGKWPYRDFFFSHPPLHIAVPALAYKLFGYHFLVGKWLSVLASLGATLATWRIARRLLGVPAGLLTVLLTLFAAEVLQASTNLTGVNLTTCWMMWGVWAILRRRVFLGGALLGAAAATGFYALGMTLAMVGLLAFQPLPTHKDAWRRWLLHPAMQVLLGFLSVWGSITLLGWMLAGDHYLTQVFSYHFAKKAKVEGFQPISGGPTAWISNLFLMLNAKDFIVVLYYHAVHLWLALLAPLAVGLRVWLDVQGGSRKSGERSPWSVLWQPRTWWAGSVLGTRMLLFVATLALVGEFGQFKERYDFYWALILPLLSICAVTTVHTLAELSAVAFRAHAPSLDRFAPQAGYAALVAAALVVAAVPVNNYANVKAYPTEFKQVGDSKGAGERLKFEWLDPPGPAWLGELTRAAFWGEGRIRGNIDTGVHHYLWNKKRWYSKAEEMAAWIRDHSKPNETITGASDYAPLLALLSGRRLAADAVDTNSKVFDTGAVRLEEFWDAVCKDNLKYIVVAPMSYFAVAQLPKRATIMQHFQLDAEFHDPKLKHWKDLEMELWVRKADVPCKFEGKRGVGPNLDATD